MALRSGRFEMKRFWRIVHKKLADPLTFLPFGWCFSFHNWTARKLESGGPDILEVHLL